MKTLTITILLCLAGLAAQAQDLIIKNDKSEIECRVTEIAETRVKYKNWSNLNGPVYSIPKADIFMIRYENGTNETFGTPTETPKEKPQEITKETPAPKVNTDLKKHSFGLGVSLFNPIIRVNKAFAKSSSGFAVQTSWSSLPNSERWFTSSVRWQIMSGTITDYDETGVNINLFGFGVEGKFNANWIHKDNLSWYSGIGIGYQAVSASYGGKANPGFINPSGMMLQIDLIGVQSWGKNFGTYAEFGFGSEGLVKYGIMYCW